MHRRKSHSYNPHVEIRAYINEDKEGLVDLIRVLQDYVAGLDPLRLNKSGKKFDVPT